LKKLGNKAFGEKRYDDAIQLYSEALDLCDIDTHILFSNRSAARTGKGLFDEAIDDATKCIQMMPQWSKGYFRKGKALLSKEEFNQAYNEFYRGLKIDPNSEELQRVLNQTKLELGPGEIDPRAILDKQLLELHFQRISQSLCEKMGVSYQSISEKVNDAVKEENGLENMLQEEPFVQIMETNEHSTYLVLAEILMNMGKNESSLIYSTKAYNMNPSDSTTATIHINTVLRNK